MKHPYVCLLGGLVVAGATLFSSTARANIFASNIKLNSALNSVTNSPGTAVNISFILNEAATLGTTINIISGTNVQRTIAVAAGNPGTLKGTNLVVWDGKNNSSQNAAPGIYSVAITPSTSGFTNWTQTSTDTNAGYYINAARGIAVDTSTNSLYYGRVFLANTATGPNPGTVPGDVDGIIKLNADGSFADEGQSNAGYSWVSDGFNDSPRFLRYGTDDKIYGLDWNVTTAGFGHVIGCDVLMTTNVVVFKDANWQNNPFAGSINNGWNTFDILNPGTTNGLIFMGDDDQNLAGYWAWHMTNGIVANTNDTIGTQLIKTTSLLPIANGGLMLDTHSNVFAASYRPNLGDTNSRVMLFSNWNGTTPFSNNIVWNVGGGDNNFRGNYDLAIDSRANPKYVALPLSISGGIRVLYATNGLVVTNATGSQTLTNLDYPNLYFGASWDAVGNLYGASSSLQKWRVFSPPSGTNQATTVSVEKIQVTGPIIITVTSISVAGSTVTINFTGLAADAPSAYTIVKSATANPASSYTNTSAAIISVGSGLFQATLPASGTVQFYRIKR